MDRAKRVFLLTVALLLGGCSGTGTERVSSCEIAAVAGRTACTLTYCGRGLWRVLSAGADSKGAVQAFSAYLGEEENCPARPFDVVRRSDGGFVATGSDGSRIVCSADGALRVFPVGGGRPVLEISSVAVADGQASVRGVLEKGEQIYGLGERLDAVGKRGQRVSLWSTDGYAKRDTTYLPIPFFCTTRGGGFFANTYRRCDADFGETEDGVWSFRADEDCIDVYLLATASPAEAVCASSRLQGGTEPPPAWSAGPIICRLAPDFAEWEGPCFSGRNGRQQIGTGIRAVYEGHERIGAKPSAMLLEGLGGRLFDRRKTVRDQDRRRQADIGRRLSESGVRVMRYLRVGEVFKAMDLPDFRPEYIVRADIYTNGVLAAADTDLIPNVPQRGRNPDVIDKQPRYRYLDVTNPAAWEWYLDSVWSVLSDCGVRGAKIDFCELLPEEGESYGGLCVRYKWHDPSVFARGALHHAYAPFFVAKLARAMRARHPADGFFAFARGGGIGSGRYPAVWAGDQWRTPYVAADQLRAILNASFSGVPYQTYDMAGYQYERQVYENVGCVNPKTRQIRLGATPEAGEEILYRRGPKVMKAEEEADLFLNSLYTAYTTCLQTHGYVRHAYDFDYETVAAYRRAVGHLKALAPYREKLARENAETGLPPVRPLVLAYPKDANVYDLDDEFLLGDALLVAPVFNGRERSVYLPEGRWLDMSKGEEIAVPAGGARRKVRLPRGVVPLFVNLQSESAALVRRALR